jgi:hypothetical protein
MQILRSIAYRTRRFQKTATNWDHPFRDDALFDLAIVRKSLQPRPTASTRNLANRTEVAHRIASHAEDAARVAGPTLPQPSVQLAFLVRNIERSRDFHSTLTHTRQALRVVPTVALENAIEHTMIWHAALMGQARRMRS